ncbi:MAG: lipoyl(octanoyl) transferase [Deltaproteobacteria bacterium]|nr:MAG: lipoyl(octanoyl) transferase [Deltaproteobacteria bacterium]
MARFVQLLGLTPYEEAHALMERLVSARAAGQGPDVVLLLEHPPVITVGRSRGAAESVLDPGGLPVRFVARGGDATLHGPGQLIAWPILGLQGPRRDLIRHLRSLERAVLDLLADLGVPAQRDPRNTGVWLPMPEGKPRKVCAIGTGARRWVTSHGLALNLTLDLQAYRRLRPCGLDPDTVTRLADHRTPCPSPQALAPDLAPYLSRALQIPIEGPVVPVAPRERADLLRELGVAGGMAPEASER